MRGSCVQNIISTITWHSSSTRSCTTAGIFTASEMKQACNTENASRLNPNRRCEQPTNPLILRHRKAMPARRARTILNGQMVHQAPCPQGTGFCGVTCILYTTSTLTEASPRCSSDEAHLAPLEIQCQQEAKGQLAGSATMARIRSGC